MSEVIIGFVGVLVGALVSGLKDWIFLRNKEADQSRYIAIRVVCMLDRFIEEASNTACDHGITGSDGESRALHDTPSCPVFPDEWTWESLPEDLMYKILIFPSDVEAAERSISFVAFHIAHPPDHEEAFEERRIQYADLGLQAIQITDQLRKKYKVPGRGAVRSLEEQFTRNKNEVEEIRKRQAQSMEELMADMELSDKGIA